MFKFIFSVFLFCQSALGAESPHSKAIEAEKRGDLRQALRFYKEDLALNPHNALTLAVIAGVSELLGDFQSEVTFASKALDENPNYIMALINRGNAYANLQKIADAENG